jgi:hypothetical protein
MAAQQKYLYQYAYLDGSSFKAVENNNLYNDERGKAEILQNYNHNSLNLTFKAGSHTAKALSVLLANNEVGLILKAISHADIVSQTIDVYDLVKIGNINMTPNLHFYEVGGEFLSNQINNVDFLTRRTFVALDPPIGGLVSDAIPFDPFVKINDGTNDYIVNAETLTNGMVSFYYPTGDDEGAPVELIDLRDLEAFEITFSDNSIPANFLSGFVNEDCTMTISNAGSIMKIGDNAFANSKFKDIEANFTGIRELGSGVQLAKTGGTITTGNPMGLVAYDSLKIALTNDVKEIDGLIIASDFFASGAKKILNDTCNALKYLQGTLTEIKNCTIVENYEDLENLDMSEVIFDNCTFAVNQSFDANPATRTLVIRNCNQKSTGSQTFKFTGFKGSIIIENSFKSAEAIYDVDDTAAYALEIDNNSFINVGANSGSLNKVLSNENRNFTPVTGATGGFLRINGNNIIRFSGNNYLTTDNQILEIPAIESIVFPEYRKWDLENGNFSFVHFDIPTHELYLYNNATKESYLKQFINNSFMKFTHDPDLTINILGSQLLEILLANDCFTVNNDGSNPLLRIRIYNDLPDDFNYSMIARNNTSFLLWGNVIIDLSNDTNDLLKNALSAAYPEYYYY